MSLSPLLRRPVVFALLAAVLLAAAGVAYLLYRKYQPPALPGPDSPAYRQYADRFQIGVAALDVEEKTQLARERLTEAIDIIPQEPAGWADRGLLYIRNGEYDKAASDLGRAHELAPDSPEIESLLGLLDEKQGRFPEAADHYRKALARDPNDVMRRFTLATLLDRLGGTDSDAEYQKQMQEILRLQPNNLFVLKELARVAAQRGDAAALRGALDRLRHLSVSWSAETRKRLDDVSRAADGPLPGAVPALVVNFENGVKNELGYARSKAAVEPRGANVGEAVQRFLRLTPLRPTPAPPDRELTFAPEPLAAVPGVAGGRWDTVLPVWLTGAPQAAVFVANGQEVRRADADGPALRFPGGPKDSPPTPHGVLALDWNNDTRADLLLAGAGGLRFYQQTKAGDFTDVTDKTGLDAATLGADYYGAWAADIDMDGDLDIVAAPRDGPVVVLRNNRDGTFKALRPFPGVAALRGFVWADLDNDGAPDAAFLDAQGKVHVFANERLGQFRRREVTADLGRPVALAAADVTDDGVLDLLALQADGGVVRLSDKEQGKGWEAAPVAGGAVLPAPVEVGDAVLLAADLDNNGGLDLIASTPRSTQVWLSDTDDKFQPLGSAPPPRVAAAAALAPGGPLTLLALSDAGQPLRLVAKGTKDYHWQMVRPRAAAKAVSGGEVKGDDRINSFGVGGGMEVRSGVLVQKQIITGPVVHFGLGERPSADVIRILWPNGAAQLEFEKPGDTAVEVEQRLTGSCPFLFTHDGRGMQFVADFMWGTPLGMYINGQAKAGFAQTQEWVKIRGDQLAARDGHYDIRVTADLWEAHFFDHLALIVVDHPADTDVWADERFALTPTTPALHVTALPRPVARAWDDRGQDVTQIVRAVDGKYLDRFGRGRFQGVTRDHSVEVDLGDDAPTEGPLWLLASGWLHPTDSSLNVAIEQGAHDRPRPLVLEVPDGKGGWKVGRDIGFPAGKNKTILIRLDGVAGTPGVARRFRLRTNMEIYWDALRYAVRLDAGRVRQQWLAPEVAELRFRGVSVMTRADDSSPELPHYDTLASKSQYWRDLIGYYTRYGDVRELLARADDRYVIMNAGDEIALKFRAPEGPPPGWKRDFIWVSDGWTKDGNLNTRFSKTVLPLPYHDLKSYDQPPGRLEDDPVYRRFPDDWQKYHTRYVTPAVFEQGLRNFRRPRP